MKLVDTNVLLSAVDQSSVHHRTARHWLDGALGGSAPVAFAWLSLIGFIRIATHPSIATNPLTTTEAMDIVDGWLPNDAISQPWRSSTGRRSSVTTATSRASPACRSSDRPDASPLIHQCGRNGPAISRSAGRRGARWGPE